MRKGTLLLILVLAITVIPVLISNAVAQDQSLNPQMRQNLQEMSAVMADISNQLRTGKMSPDAQKTAALVTKQVSQILQELSGTADADHQGHKKKVEKMKKDWNPWGSADEGGAKD
jgi:predicted PurR-regulated permease PerM